MIPFTAPKDYSEMLNKIGVFTLAGALILTWIASLANADINSALSAGTVKIPIAGIELPLFFVVPALLIAIGFRVVKLHDRVSDLFRIREDFDLHEILTPLAAGVGIPTTLDLLRAYRTSRDDLMNRVFYRYTGSPAPKIPEHYTTMALDMWTWYWIITEFEVYGVLGVTVLACSGAYRHATLLLAVMWLGLLALRVLGRTCAGHAHTEVRLILENKTWRDEIGTVFGEVSTKRS